MLVVLIEAPIALIILGPLGAICGNVLSTVVYTIHDKLGFIAIGLVAGVYPFVVMAGMHHAFTPIKLGMIASTGFENFICIGELCSNMAQGAASLAVAVKSKNKDFKQIAGSSAFSALFAGITEPALYGVTLRLKRPMLGACIGAAAGGLFGGFFQMKCFWHCDTCDRNNRSVCRKRETAESVICSTYDSPYNSGCIHCDNDHWI